MQTSKRECNNNIIKLNNRRHFKIIITLQEKKKKKVKFCQRVKTTEEKLSFLKCKVITI